MQSSSPGQWDVWKSLRGNSPVIPSRNATTDTADRSTNNANRFSHNTFADPYSQHGRGGHRGSIGWFPNRS